MSKDYLAFSISNSIVACNVRRCFSASFLSMALWRLEMMIVECISGLYGILWSLDFMVRKYKGRAVLRLAQVVYRALSVFKELSNLNSKVALIKTVIFGKLLESLTLNFLRVKNIQADMVVAANINDNAVKRTGESNINILLPHSQVPEVDRSSSGVHDFMPFMNYVYPCIISLSKYHVNTLSTGLGYRLEVIGPRQLIAVMNTSPSGAALNNLEGEE